MSDFDLKDLPQNIDLFSKVIEGKFKNQQTIMEGGFIGKIFGGPKNISYNVIALSVLIFVVCLLILVIKGSGTSLLPYKECISVISNLITLLIGYLFGKSINKDN